MADAYRNAQLIEEAEYQGLTLDEPELPGSAVVGKGIEALGRTAADIIGPSALTVTANIAGDYYNYEVPNSLTTVYGNPFLNRIWAGQSSCGPLAIVGKLDLPPPKQPALYQRLGIPEVILKNPELAKAIHNLVVFAIESSKLIQLDPQFTKDFGEIRDRDALNRTKLLITHGLLAGIPFAPNAIKFPISERSNWAEHLAEMESK